MAAKNGTISSDDEEDEFIAKIKAAAAAKKEKLGAGTISNLQGLISTTKIDIDKENDSFFVHADQILSRENFENVKSALRFIPANPVEQRNGEKSTNGNDVDEMVENEQEKALEDQGHTDEPDSKRSKTDENVSKATYSVLEPTPPETPFLLGSNGENTTEIIVLNDDDDEHDLPISTDDSIVAIIDELPSESSKVASKTSFQDQVMIFVKIDGKMEKFILNKDDKLEVLFKSVAQSMHLSINEISILRNGYQYLSQFSTPCELAMDKVEMLECIRNIRTENPVQVKPTTKKPLAKDENCINLKFQHGGRKCMLDMIVNKLDSFEIIKEKYIKERGLPTGTTIKFMFDGEIVDEKISPADLDMEDDDCVDAMI